MVVLALPAQVLIVPLVILCSVVSSCIDSHIALHRLLRCQNPVSGANNFPTKESIKEKSNLHKEKRISAPIPHFSHLWHNLRLAPESPRSHKTCKQISLSRCVSLRDRDPYVASISYCRWVALPPFQMSGTNNTKKMFNEWRMSVLIFFKDKDLVAYEGPEFNPPYPLQIEHCVTLPCENLSLPPLPNVSKIPIAEKVDMILNKNAGRSDNLNFEHSTVNDPKNIRVKLVLLGDSGVGKSCIVLRFVRGQFDPTSKVTVGASFLSQTIALQDSTTVKFEIWDTAGQERYAALAPLYYRGAAVAVVVYDITSPDSFLKAQYWVKVLSDIVMALVGNKADLHENRRVSAEEAAEYAEKNGMFFIETSAKTADNINQLFEVVTNRTTN
ncbi:hypothetical protein KFK09_009845 [Dendrobium nobile]|uniref:Ras-related protein RABF1 n=1 Tax=Dendrobium nobile TaxID=94219 RepID=A0A8T3BL55_DENNO|nr:hypothetical protein KFK09_009845 [Dendrobium nobile]